MDIQVKTAQKWLNTTYGNVSGWVRLDEDGITGWATMYGLRRALQVELGVSPISSGFGAATTAAFTSQIGQFDSRITSTNLLGILSSALWCKGYTGLYWIEDGTFADLADSVRGMRVDLGLAGAPAQLDVKLFASLLSMDAYTKTVFGTDRIRGLQQWLNKTYLGRRDFAVVPCDGIYSRQIQRAMLFAVQYEIGMDDGVANGNFGAGTKLGLRTQAVFGAGAKDTIKNFVRLFQGALCCNGYGVDVDGEFGIAGRMATIAFQGFMELPETEVADYGTWCALLVSSGDTDRATSGCDTNVQLTRADLAQLSHNHYDTVGRYLVGASKFITPDEFAAFKAEGMRLVPIHQRYNNSIVYMTAANGRTHAIEAVKRARLIGLPADTTLYFSIDFDALDDAIPAIRTYFTAIRDHFNTLREKRYRIGIYATRNVCDQLMAFQLADDAYVSGMSNGYSGNMGFPLPSGWSYNQIVETSTPGGGRSVAIDKVVVSRSAKPVVVADLPLPPKELEGAPTETGYDEYLRWVTELELAIEAEVLFGTPLMLDQTLPNALRRKAGYTSTFWDAYFAGLPDGLLLPDPWAAVLARVGETTTRRDHGHFAAAYLGYRHWSRIPVNGLYEYGDIAAWALDLLQIYGSWDSGGRVGTLGAYLDTYLGSTDPASTFGYGDVVADADAYLCAQEGATGLWSDVIRAGLRQDTPGERVRRFGQARLDMSSQRATATLASIIDGLDAIATNFDFTADWVQQRAEYLVPPTQAELEILGQKFIRCLQNFA